MALCHTSPPHTDVCGTVLGRKAGAGKERRLILWSRAVLPSRMCSTHCFASCPASHPASCPESHLASHPTCTSSQTPLLSAAACFKKGFAFSLTSPQPCKCPRLGFEWLLSPFQRACSACPGPPCLCSTAPVPARAETHGCSFALDSGQGRGRQSLPKSYISSWGIHVVVVVVMIIIIIISLVPLINHLQMHLTVS